MFWNNNKKVKEKKSSCSKKKKNKTERELKGANGFCEQYHISQRKFKFYSSYKIFVNIFILIRRKVVLIFGVCK